MTQQVLKKTTVSVLQQFMQAVLKNRELQEKLKVAADWENFVKQLVDLGKQSGYCFRAEDVEATIQEKAISGFVKTAIDEGAIAQLRSEQSRTIW